MYNIIIFMQHAHAYYSLYNRDISWVNFRGQQNYLQKAQKLDPALKTSTLYQMVGY